MLNSGCWLPDQETGQYFIDRSPHMFPVILDYLREGRVCPIEKFGRSELEMLRTELDFYQISVPQLEPVCWDAESCAGLCRCSEDTRRVQVSAVALEGRSIYTQPFAHGLRVVEFTLKVTATAYGIGMPGLYFGEWGLALVAGSVTEDTGAHWEPAFPSMDFPEDYEGVHKYRFTLDTTTLELTVNWPTGNAKKWVLPEKCTAAYMSNRSTSAATFELL
eukprot:TRINITY_DN94679_c0_g1_i1.p1 TRINITY_DN94679_c0_g1~~TRINITY_DN94679_c0_g1_i1.p1  ORF type:complete len:219 (+),score=21.32 TRINITY_DN94679_c0_g1_i1:305-961(+)